MITGRSVTGQCDRHLSGAVVRPQSLPQAVAGPLSRKGLHIYIYCTVKDLLIITVSILYFIIWKKAILCQDIITDIQNAYWQLKTGHLNYFHSLHVKHIEFCWYAFILQKWCLWAFWNVEKSLYSDLMIFIGLVKLWQCPLVWSEGQGSWEIVSAA